MSEIDRLLASCQGSLLFEEELRDLVAITGTATTEQIPVRAPELLIWHGNDRAFGDFINKLYEEKKIPGGAPSRNKAFEIMCARYVRADGTPLKPASIQQSLRNRKDKEGK